MKDKIRELLYRSLDGELSAAESKALERALAESPSLRDELLAAQTVRRLLGDQPEVHFEPYFAQRVMQRLDLTAARETMSSLLAGALARLFRPVAVATAAVVIVLAAWNVVATGELSPSEEDTISVTATDSMMQTPLDALLQEPS